eukprot:8419784-Ditylum_brightwellii.AAC.1
MGDNLFWKVVRYSKTLGAIISCTSKNIQFLWKTRPVVSSDGSMLATVSTWVDYHLQKSRMFLPS